MDSREKVGRLVRSRAAVAVTTALVVSGGVALAAIPSSTDGTITACYATRDGAVRFVDTAADCSASKERAVQFNAQGRQGPTGATGSTGAAGPAGPTGAQGPAGNDGRDGSDGKDGAQGEVGPTGPAGPTGATGPTGPPGPAGAVTYFANVSGDGELKSGNATGVVGSGGDYTVSFPQDISECAPIFSLGNTRTGSSQVYLVGTTVTYDDSVNDVGVLIREPTDPYGAKASDFHLAVIC